MQTSGTAGMKAAGGSGEASLFPRGYMASFALTTSIFFVWGMSNNLTDILVQQFKKSFELSLLEAQLVQTSVFLAYGIMATPAALLMRRCGYKTGLVVGLVTFGTGTLLFWPAAVIGQYGPFLVALFIVGSGSSILETAANPLVAQFGDERTSEQRLNFSQAFNPPGTIIGVLIGTWFIFSGVEKKGPEVAAMKAAGTYAAYLHEEIVRVVPTYVVFGLVVMVLAFLIGRANFPASLDAVDGAIEGRDGAAHHGAYGRLLRRPQLMLAVVALFFCVGAQVGTWSTFIPYLREYTSFGDRASGYLLTGTLVAFAVGRIVSTSMMRMFSPAKMMMTYAGISLLLCVAGVAYPGMAGGMAIFASSFFMSIMYPTIFALGVKGLGGDTKLGGSMLVMAIVGGAIFPPAMAWMTRLTGSVAMGYLLPGIGYAVVGLYGYAVTRMARGRVEEEIAEGVAEVL